MTFESELDAVLQDPRVERLVRTYFNEPAKGFAGTLFTDLGSDRPYEITTEDVLAVSLLDVPFRGTAIRCLVADPARQQKVGTLLTQIPYDLPIWEAKDEIEQGSPAWRLWKELDSYPDVGPARVSKLLARKRPHLIPIQDTVVRKLLPSGRDNYWAAFREALRDSARREAIESLRGGLPAEISTLRLIDAAIWMLGSNAGNAKSERGD